jgi:hypothetical protein
MGDAATGFEAWRQALADTVTLAREIDCHPAVVQTLAAMIGDARPEDWRDNGPYWMHTGSDAPWNQAAKEAAHALEPADLVAFVHRAFNTGVRFEQMRASRFDQLLLKRAWPTGSRQPGYLRASWAYVGWAGAITIKAALKRKPGLADETALRQLHALQLALLHWAADHVSEPDLPLKEMLAWVATHRFGVRTQAAALVERIARIIELVPAADAEDRRYTAQLMKSVESLRAQFAQALPPTPDPSSRAH